MISSYEHQFYSADCAYSAFHPHSKPTRVYFKGEDRFSELTSAKIDYPPDYAKSSYQKARDSAMGTPKEIVEAQTWAPDLEVSPFPPAFENELYRLRRKRVEHIILSRNFNRDPRY